jgi:hypothetical protein
MPDLDQTLRMAGDRWRATQPAPRSVDPAIFAAAPATGAWGWRLAGTAVVAVALVAVIGAGAWWSRQTPAPAAAGRDACAVTMPDPAFTAPAPFPAHPTAAYPDSDWFGTAQLWTLLPDDDADWSDLPRTAEGFGQKTFWWSAGFDPSTEATPDLVVTARQLDGGAEASGGLATNATADLGAAMLVSVSFPTAGCWEVTGTYDGATLSYVVWVG